MANKLDFIFLKALIHFKDISKLIFNVAYNTSYISNICHSVTGGILPQAQSDPAHKLTYRPLELKLPELVVGKDLHVAVWPRVVHGDAGGHLHTGIEVNLDAHFGLNPVLKVTSDFNASSDQPLSGKTACNGNCNWPCTYPCT